jgi:Domain of unknown function (DUF4436)
MDVWHRSWLTWIFKDGDINSYPFDVYTTNYEIDAFTSPTNISYGTPLPLTVFAQGTVQGFNVDTAFQGLFDDGSSLQITFTVRRSNVVKAFAIIISIGSYETVSDQLVLKMVLTFRCSHVVSKSQHFRGRHVGLVQGEEGWTSSDRDFHSTPFCLAEYTEQSAWHTSYGWDNIWQWVHARAGSRAYVVVDADVFLLCSGRLFLEYSACCY